METVSMIMTSQVWMCKYSCLIGQANYVVGLGFRMGGPFKTLCFQLVANWAHRYWGHHSKTRQVYQPASKTGLTVGFFRLYVLPKASVLSSRRIEPRWDKEGLCLC